MKIEFRMMENAGEGLEVLYSTTVPWWHPVGILEGKTSVKFGLQCHIQKKCGYNMFSWGSCQLSSLPAKFY